MAQGQVKKPKTATQAKPTQRKQTGSRVIKPKKSSLQKANLMKKKLSSGLTERTERSLAGKAGHLEMLAGGKKDKKPGAVAAGANAAGAGAGAGPQKAQGETSHGRKSKLR